MKRTLNNPNTWQEKRAELPIIGDAGMDWLQMQAMLDERMPVSAPVKKPYRLKHTKWWVKGLIVTASAIIVYTAVQLYLSNRDNTPSLQHQQENRRDTINAVPPPNSAKNTIITPDKNAPAQEKPAAADTAAGTTKRVPDNVGRQGKTIIDSGKTQRHPNNALNLDSLVAPVNINTPKTVHDTVKLPPVINNKPIRQDTSGAGKKGSKKKHRPKMSIFT